MRPLSSGVIVGCALMLAGCAHQAAPPAAAPAPSSAVQGGVIVSRRPATGEAEAAGTLLRVLAPADSGPAGMVPSEFIVRTDAGATLSVVQDDGATLHVGDRVAIGRARLTRAPAGG